MAPRRRRGTFLILTVVGLFLLLGAAALVTDIGYARAQQVRVQGLVDAIALSVLATLDAEDPDLGATAERRARKVAIANGISPESLQVEWTDLDRLAVLELQARLKSPAFLGGAFGQDDFDVMIRAAAEGKRPEKDGDAEEGSGGAGRERFDDSWKPGWGEAPEGGTQGSGGAPAGGGGPQVTRRGDELGDWTFGGGDSGSSSPSDAGGGGGGPGGSPEGAGSGGPGAEGSTGGEPVEPAPAVLEVRLSR